jgi:hypothetical protein
MQRKLLIQQKVDKNPEITEESARTAWASAFPLDKRRTVIKVHTLLNFSNTHEEFVLESHVIYVLIFCQVISSLSIFVFSVSASLD